MTRYGLITARMALSHSTGFPNWRMFEPDGRLKFLFAPGSRHSYSGEGIDLLQMVVEEVTGRDLETLAREKVFEPLGMTRTGYVWQEAFDANAARPHDEFGRPKSLPRRNRAGCGRLHGHNRRGLRPAAGCDPQCRPANARRRWTRCCGRRSPISYERMGDPRAGRTEQDTRTSTWRGDWAGAASTPGRGAPSSTPATTSATRTTP